MLNFADFDKDVLRTTNSDLNEDIKLLIIGLGLTGEAGEVAELIKKHKGHNHSLDKEKLVKELGDVLFYISWLAQEIDSSLEEVVLTNVNKRELRYPKGFTIEQSYHKGE